MRPVLRRICHVGRTHQRMLIVACALSVLSSLWVAFDASSRLFRPRVDLAPHIQIATTEITDLEVKTYAITPIQEWPDPASNMPTLDIDNWAPTGLQTNSFIVVRGADNEGSRITGIDTTNIQVGDVRYMVNLPTGASQPTDSGTITFVHESTDSLAANRIQTPGAVDCTIPMYAVVGLVYGGLDGNTPQTNRWHLLNDCGQNFGSGSTKTQRFQLYPNCAHGNGTTVTVSGTINNYRPTCENKGFNAGYWLAGATTDSWDYTTIRVYTAAGGATLTGMYHPAVLYDPRGLGAVKIIQNVGAGTLTLKHLDAGSDVNSRFNLPRSRDTILQPNESIVLYSPINNAVDNVAQWWAVATAQSNEMFPTATVAGTTDLQGPLELSGVTTPAALAAGTNNNYDPGSRNAVWRLAADASGSTVTGIVAPVLGDYEVHFINNVGTGILTITHLDAGSAVGNKFYTPRALPMTIASGGGAMIRYDWTTSAWRVIAYTGVANPVTYTSALINSLVRYTDVNGATTTAAVTDNGSTVDIGAGRSVTVSGATTFNATLAMGATQQFQGYITGAQSLSISNRLVPTALTSASNNNDWNPTNLRYYTHVVLQTSTGSTATLTGMNALGANGETKTLCNFGSGAVKITNNDPASTAGYRFTLADGIDTTLPTVATGKIYCIGFRYDASTSRWEERWRNFYGKNPSSPTLSSCGTTPTLGTNCTNEACTITTGSGATACTYTFGGGGFTNPPSCTVAAQDGTARAYTVTTTAIALTAASASAKYDVICQGK